MASDILTLNAGSSTLKFSLWQSGTEMDLQELFRGEVEKIRIDPHLSAWGPGGEAVIDRGFGEGGANLTHEDLLRELFAWLSQQRQDELEAIGHRIVHGGATFTAPVCINDDVLYKLSKLEPLAPLHQPHNLSGVRTCAALHPHVPQVACFDTAFHQTMDPLARRLGLPRARIVRKYARRFTVQERIAQEVANELERIIEPHGVIVHLRARHSCTQCRGVREMSALTRIIERRGDYVSNHQLVAEFMSLARLND
jgi:acetate kinase